MTHQKQKVAAKRDPSVQEAAAIEKATHAFPKRPQRPSIEWSKGSVSIAHSDTMGAHAQRMNDAYGTSSLHVDAAFSGMLDHVTLHRGQKTGYSDIGFNAGLAIMSAIEPRNELEAALALQMTGTHFLAIEMLGRARGTDRTDHIEVYGNMAVKLQRTFAAQIESLSKLRGGGKQTVEVKHTYVDARNSQNVIADNVTTGGGQNGNENQPHAKAIPDNAGSPFASMWSPDAVRVPLSGAGDQEQA